MNVSFALLLFAGVLLATRSNPLSKERGMDFWYDTIDWLGGYPYEYASVTEVKQRVEELGFVIDRVQYPRIGTGCVEYVFRRAPAERNAA